MTESSVCGIVSSCPEIGSTASAASAATAAATLSAAPATCATAATASATDKTLLGLFSVILRPDQLILQLLLLLLLVLLLLLSATASAASATIMGLFRVILRPGPTINQLLISGLTVTARQNDQVNRSIDVILKGDSNYDCAADVDLRIYICKYMALQPMHIRSILC